MPVSQGEGGDDSLWHISPKLKLRKNLHKRGYVWLACSYARMLPDEAEVDGAHAGNNW